MNSPALMLAAILSALIACDARPPGKGPANPEPPAKHSPVAAHAPESGADHHGHTALVQEEEPKGPIHLQITSKLRSADSC